MIRNMCFVPVFWPVLSLERLFLCYFHVEARPAGNLLFFLQGGRFGVTMHIRSSCEDLSTQCD